MPTKSLRPRGAAAWILTGSGVVALLVAVLASVTVLWSVGYASVGTIGYVVLLFAPQVFFVALVLAAATVLALRRRAAIATVSFALSTLLAAALSLVPTLSERARARHYGVSVGLGSVLVPEVHAPAPAPETVTYGTAPDGVRLLLDVWRSKQTKAGTRRPAIVKVHGGGFVHGARNERPNWIGFFNELGYDVFDVEYRLPPPVRFRDEVGDVKCAIGWVVENAERYGIDTHRISLMGNSAGGNLALVAAYSMGNPLVPPSCHEADVEVRSVINLYGPTDLKKLYATTGSPDYVRPLLHAYLGGPLLEFTNRYELLSPIRHVNAKTPPTITLHGEADRVIPKAQAELLDEKLTERGIAHETYFFPWSDHGFDGIWSSFATQTARAKVAAFLRKHG